MILARVVKVNRGHCYWLLPIGEAHDEGIRSGTQVQEAQPQLPPKGSTKGKEVSRRRGAHILGIWVKP